MRIIEELVEIWPNEVCDSTIRKANSKLELSQLLFISVRQRELIRVLAVLSLSTYTNSSWSMHSLLTLLTKLCDVM